MIITFVLSSFPLEEFNNNIIIIVIIIILWRIGRSSPSQLTNRKKTLTSLLTSISPLIMVINYRHHYPSHFLPPLSSPPLPFLLFLTQQPLHIRISRVSVSVRTNFIICSKFVNWICCVCSTRNMIYLLYRCRYSVLFFLVLNELLKVDNGRDD